MPATSIFMRALSSGMSGIGYSRISVLLGPVRTAASTCSATARVSKRDGAAILFRRNAARDRLIYGRAMRVPLGCALVGGAGTKEGDLVVGAANELHRERQARFRQPAHDRQGR